MCDSIVGSKKVAVFQYVSNRRRFDVLVEEKNGIFEITDPRASGWVGPFMFFKRRPAQFIGLQDRFFIAAA
jgi:hypothetical protein